jgi:hypothetical protein
MWVVAAAPDSATAAAAPPVNLGAASTFAALSGGVLTNVGATTIKGDLGVSPALAVVGPPPTVTGAVHIGDTAAAAAQTGLAAAYADVTSRTATGSAGPVLSGTLFPGVYNSAVALTLPGNLTLDAQGDPNAIFIIRGLGLVTSPASTITLAGGAQACNVYFAFSTAAVTLGAGSTFRGNLLVHPAIAGAVALLTGATVDGRVLLGPLGALVLNGNTITLAPACAVPPPPPGGRGTTTTVTSSCMITGTQGGPTLTATVRGASGAAIPTGLVVFTSDGVSLGSAPLNAGGVATLPAPNLTPGEHRIVAAYPGTALLDPSTSMVLIVRIGPGGTCAKAEDDCKEKDGENTGKKDGEQDGEHTATHPEKNDFVKKQHRRDRHHHHKDHKRLVTVQTLHTLHGFFDEGGHGGHHSDHRSWSHHRPGHHHHVHQVFHKKPHYYKHHVPQKRYHVVQRPRVAVTG